GRQCRSQRSAKTIGMGEWRERKEHIFRFCTPEGLIAQPFVSKARMRPESNTRLPSAAGRGKTHRDILMKPFRQRWWRDSRGYALFIFHLELRPCHLRE